MGYLLTHQTVCRATGRKSRPTGLGVVEVLLEGEPKEAGGLPGPNAQALRAAKWIAASDGIGGRWWTRPGYD